MVSSHTVWHAMHASTHSCISLLMAAAVPGWFMVMVPPGAAGARGGPRALPVLRPAAGERHPAEPTVPPRSAGDARPVGRARVAPRPGPVSQLRGGGA
ncbi:hypothetical protein GCM10018783_54210 [Streptomyces griseosporeus]|nr:hypothetical protein GCM10018783_54210 [Streptomyces griseosporeus]